MEDLSTVKTCSKCKESCNIGNFYTKKKIKKDGTPVRDSWCVLCKMEYNNEYMRRRRQDPEFREKEKKYIEEWSKRKHGC
jgi:hypothetical protein